MVAAHDAASFIEASLRSVLAQDFHPFEVVLYDDGSTDGTSALVRDRLADERIRLYRSEENRGVVHARNRLVRLARGEYLVPHDHDDLMLPGRLKAQARCLDRHPDVGVVVGAFRITGENTVGRPREMIPWVQTAAGRRNLRGGQARGVFPLGLHHGAAMIRRSVLLAAGGYDPRWEGIEDFDLLARLSARTRFHVLGHVAFVYQRRPDSVSGRLLTQSQRARRLLAPAARRFRALLRLAGTQVEITSDRRRPVAVMAEALALETGGAGRRHRELAVEVRSGAAPRRWADLGLDSQALARLRRQGVTHRLDRTGRLASVVIDPTRRLPDEMIYHAGFLHPLSHALHEAGATLAHAALLARGTSGVLIMGESGSGKSTLSLALVRRGYAYFSDEHPSLAAEGDVIIGRGFANRIGVSAVSLANFPELRGLAVWSRRRRKWYVTPGSVWPGCVGQACRIDTVLFPRFRAGARSRTRRLSALQFLRRLQQDEYYGVLAKLGDGARGAREAHLRLLLKLVRSAAAFEITYGPRDIAAFPARLEALRRTLTAHASTSR